MSRPLADSLGHSAAPSANLKRLIDRVWGVEDQSVTVSMGPAPSGHRVVEQYAVVPGFSSARWLLPVGAHAATVSSLWRYVAMKRLPLQMLRAGLTGAFATGLGYRLFADRLTISLDPGAGPDADSEKLLLSHLADILQRRPLFAAVEVRRANANSKPTLQLFDSAGSAVGYARVGWSPGTRQLVQAESAALEAVHSPDAKLVTPRLLAAGQWRDREFSVASPLPEPMRRWAGAPQDSVEVLEEIYSSSPVVEGTLAGSGYERGLRAQLLSSSAAEPEAASVLIDWLDALAKNEAALRFGRWHGDWVPWNHGRHRGRVVAWDWEHSAPQVPVGFDLLHWYFQPAVPEGGLDAAVAAVERATPQLGVLGVPPRSRPLVASLYLLEMFARVTRMAVGGGGWNPRFHPQMLQVAHEWATCRRDLAS